ncbi:unnamed protein product [Bursaphelenchus okinawaensis]|uniref:SCP domain-containing protein n=1 Tax=Bursaphelenchus okinawaensis TaxID=465554 RepID=A0A811KJH5_9BILA|nr:unnamed protein product [Bursaphelenchus okinawaensis]CAG9104195.1 unnamed protein product [Bursaphelenchus okinawaensis]
MTVQPHANGHHPFALQFLDANNSYRRKHSVPELQLSLELCTLATEWACFLASQRYLKYKETPDLGENITFFPKSLTAKEVCDYWYKESKVYEYNTPGWQPGTNYFTQVIWKDTKEIGIGTAPLPLVFHKHPKTNDTIPNPLNGYKVVVAFYSPPGNNNHAGQFAANVIPPLKELTSNQGLFNK